MIAGRSSLKYNAKRGVTTRISWWPKRTLNQIVPQAFEVRIVAATKQESSASISPSVLQGHMLLQHTGPTSKTLNICYGCRYHRSSFQPVAPKFSILATHSWKALSLTTTTPSCREKSSYTNVFMLWTPFHLEISSPVLLLTPTLLSGSTSPKPKLLSGERWWLIAAHVGRMSIRQLYINISWFAWSLYSLATRYNDEIGDG